MVSPSKVQYSRVASQHANKVRPVKGDKPLMNFCFYLDIQNHAASTRIDNYIKKLGGSIEFLLSKKLTHIVTDKIYPQTTNGTRAANDLDDPKQSPAFVRTPGTPYSIASAQLSISSTDVGSPYYAGDNSNEAKTPAPHSRTRAGAMLQLAQQRKNDIESSTYSGNSRAHHKQHTANNGDTQGPTVYEALNSWGITHWTPQQALKVFEKIIQTNCLNRVTNNHNSSIITTYRASSACRKELSQQARRLTSLDSPSFARPIALRGNYIKLESFDRRFRPYSQQLKVWPIIELWGEDKAGAFISQGTTKNNNNNHCNNNNKTNNHTKQISHMMTRKGRGKVGSARTPTAPKQVAATKNPVVTNDSSKISKEITTNTTTATSTNTGTTTTSSSGSADPKVERGYCEICRIEYEALTTHLKTSSHINFARNDANFVTLDRLISNDKSSVSTFLKKNTLEKTPSTKSSPSKPVSRPLPIAPTRNGDLSVTNGAESVDSELAFGKRSFGRRIGSTGKLAAVPNEQKTDPDNLDIRHMFNSTALNGRKRLCHNLRPNSEESAPPSIEQQKLQQRARRESAKRVNYAEPREDDENGVKIEDGSAKAEGSVNNKLGKIRARGIQWRAPATSANSPNTPNPTPCLYKVIERDQKRKITPPPSPKIVPQPPAKIASDYLAVEEDDLVADTAEVAVSVTTMKIQKDAAGLIVKLKRVRQSELSALNDEAENFMFPKRNNSNVFTDEDRHTTSEPAENSIELISSEADRKLPFIKTEPNPLDDTDESDDYCLTSGAATRSSRRPSDLGRRKRRNQLEAFLNDNTEYYKFDTPGSRLRFQDAPIQPTLTTPTTVLPSVKNATSTTTTPTKSSSDALKRTSASADVKLEVVTDNTGAKDNDKALEDGMGELRKFKEVLASESIQRLKFSFERVPSAEPWFEAFQRQDESRERIFEYYGSTAYRKLPYEMGPLPALPPDCCFLAKLLGDGNQQTRGGAKRNYRRKKQLAPVVKNEEPEKTETSKSTNGIHTLSSTSKNEAMTGTGSAHNSTSSAMARKEDKAVTRSSDAASKKLSGAERRKKKLLMEMAYPRKSPREHASTLAILSCLVQQRKKRELTSSPCCKNNQQVAGSSGETGKETETTGDGGNSNPTAFTMPPEEDYVDIHRLTREVDSMLTMDNDFETSDLDAIEINETECVDLCRSSEFNLSDCFGDCEFDNVQDEHKIESTLRGLLSGGRLSTTKKRKNNRTGWPTASKKRRLVPQLNNRSTIVPSSVTNRSHEEDDDLEEDIDDDDDDDEAARRPSYNPAFVEEDDESSAVSPTAAAHNGVIDVSSQLEGEEFILTQRMHHDTEADDDEEIDEDDDGEESLSDGLDTSTAACISSSDDKAEISDIFNVSSDSLDTASTETDVVTKLDDKFMTPTTVVIRGDMQQLQRPNRGNVRFRKKCSSAVSVGKRRVLNRNARQNKSSLLAIPSSSPKTSSAGVAGMRQSPQLSPRKLRKPRGCWYRER